MYKHHTTKEKLALLELAEKLKNVSAACKTLGFSRDSYYVIKKAYDEQGVESFRDRRRKGNTQNRVAHKRDKRSLIERLQFESLISELSAKFINLPEDLIVQEINNAQQKVCEALGLHRSIFFENLFDMKKSLMINYNSRSENFPNIDISKFEDDFKYARKMCLEGRMIVFSDPDELPAEAESEKLNCTLFNIASGISFPLKTGDTILAVITWVSIGIHITWPQTVVDRLRLISEVFANALFRKRSDEALRESITEIKKLKDKLQAENIYLMNEIQLEHKHHQIVGKSVSIKNVLKQVETVGVTNATVLILGETGTGKELLASEIHRLSSRKDRHMIKVNCSALPPTLIESELFGHEKGAYTGATSKKPGRFEMATGSSIFLDEIGDLPLSLQPKLLRVLQEGQFERVGGVNTINVDVRIIAATNKNLVTAVREGQFRKDLFYRLNVFPITLPPLRERAEDIPMLVTAFVREFSKTMGKTIDTIPAKNLNALKRYPWPGNIRELRNLIERAMIFSKGSSIEIKVPETIDLETPEIYRMDEIQRNHILQVLKKTDWQICGAKGAANLLGMNPSTLRARMKRLGIRITRTEQSDYI
ncbi:MAG: sigma 54-interacting transcriptional regulator [Desulfatitalea sp.]|nr:sigma 54-interacting transcriptional regulator [Desulfatitalea sp.]